MERRNRVAAPAALKKEIYSTTQVNHSQNNATISAKKQKTNEDKNEK